MTVGEIVREYLEQHGFDGLCSNYCACKNDDLIPCSERCDDCRAGYFRKQGPDDEEADFYIGPKKDKS